MALPASTVPPKTSRSPAPTLSLPTPKTDSTTAFFSTLPPAKFAGRRRPSSPPPSPKPASTTKTTCSTSTRTVPAGQTDNKAPWPELASSSAMTIQGTNPHHQHQQDPPSSFSLPPSSSPPQLTHHPNPETCPSHS